MKTQTKSNVLCGSLQNISCVSVKVNTLKETHSAHIDNTRTSRNGTHKFAERHAVQKVDTMAVHGMVLMLLLLLP